MAETINLTPQLEQCLPRELFHLLQLSGDLARQRRENLYLVGGAVRDLLLRRANLDLDLVVEGDAPALARLVAQQWGGEVVVHQRFGTAKLRQGELTLDLATARAESYPRPGALPVVRPGTIQEDLFRRDFSINAIALHLNPPRFGELLDPYQGQADLQQGLLRVLHPRSFIDDATRILRALRYEQRLGFQLEPETERLLRRDREMLHTISGDRLRQELELILKEEYPEKVLRRAEELGVLPQIHPALRGDGWLGEKFPQARCWGDRAALPALYLSLLLFPLTPEEGEDFIRRLRVPGATARVIRDTLQLKGILELLAASRLPPSAIYRRLKGYSPRAIQAVALAADSDSASQQLRLYLERLRYVRPSLNGEALQQMGVPPGPRIGEILQSLQEARLDQKVRTREEEEELVRRWLAQPAGKSPGG